MMSDDIPKQSHLSEAWEAIVMWHNPVQSGGVLAFGVLVYALVEFAGYSLLSLCFSAGALLMVLAFVYRLYLDNHKPRKRFPLLNWEAELYTAAAAWTPTLNAVAVRVCRIAAWEDWKASLTALAFTTLLSFISSFMGLGTLLGLLWLAAFSLPFVWDSKQQAMRSASAFSAPTSAAAAPALPPAVFPPASLQEQAEHALRLQEQEQQALLILQQQEALQTHAHLQQQQLLQQEEEAAAAAALAAAAAAAAAQQQQQQQVQYESEVQALQEQAFREQHHETLANPDAAAIAATAAAAAAAPFSAPAYGLPPSPPAADALQAAGAAAGSADGHLHPYNDGACPVTGLMYKTGHVRGCLAPFVHTMRVLFAEPVMCSLNERDWGHWIMSLSLDHCKFVEPPRETVAVFHVGDVVRVTREVLLADSHVQLRFSLADESCFVVQLPVSEGDLLMGICDVLMRQGVLPAPRAPAPAQQQLQAPAGLPAPQPVPPSRDVSNFASRDSQQVQQPLPHAGADVSGVFAQLAIANAKLDSFPPSRTPLPAAY